MTRCDLLPSTLSAMAMALAASGAEPLCISGVYPHLAVFNSQEKDGGTYGSGGECGIGAVVPWAGRLWLLTYSPHCPTGSSDKLYAIAPDLTLDIRPESIGGTPAGRLIHRESNQLFIGPYAIAADGSVRPIPYERMPGRHTAVARHLSDPANRVYYVDMEGRIYDLDVHTLEPRLLFRKPVPGWHAKGGYSSQGRLVISNNGELEPAGHSYDDLVTGGPPATPEDIGALAEWDGATWRVIERRQFTEVTGPGGIEGAPAPNSPLWAVGWDRRSVIVKLLDAGVWHTFRLPKGTHSYDGRGGWYTEWPRIREIAPGRLMLDMHGLFWTFPSTFAAGTSGGLRPIATHHRYVPDFCHWNGRIVLASDDTAIMGNPMAGQSQSNLWFGTEEDLTTWGPRNGWGGPWVNDSVGPGEASTPFAIGGFPQRCIHLAVGGSSNSENDLIGMQRTSGRFPLSQVPQDLKGLQRVTIARGDYHQPAPAYAFTVNQPVTIFLAVDARPEAALGEGWTKTDLETRWGDYTDHIYKKNFEAGLVAIPGHPQEHKPGDYGLPHLCFVKPREGPTSDLLITALPAALGARVTPASVPRTPATTAAGNEVTITLTIDRQGTGVWELFREVTVPNPGYTYVILPADLPAEWIRFSADRACVATAYLHLSDPNRNRARDDRRFAALAAVDDRDAVGGIIRPAAKSRNLQFLLRENHQGTVQERSLEVDASLHFHAPLGEPTEDVRKLAEVTRDFEVDEASVIITEKGQSYRLPKGDPAYDQPFATGWPRGTRECVSERHLMNLHGTFYERPLEAGIEAIKPMATHGRQVLDFCTWRGLWVLCGTRRGAETDGHAFASATGDGLWFGAIDDIWALGKPVGHGGPWHNTTVEAGVPSDPYLMTNYDRKRVELSHNAQTAVSIRMEVNVDHTGWHTYAMLTVPAAKTLRHTFPESYAAHWVRVCADRNCRATAFFIYE